MGRILYVWERGSGYGHVGSAAPLAHRLRDRGHEVVFALRDLAHAERFLGRRGFRVLQAPVWVGERRGPELPVNYAEMLGNFGFLDRRGLTGMVKAWRELYTLLRPDLLLVDHGPTALLAARGTGRRVALIGTGFHSPPRTSPMPSLRPWLNVPAERLLESEQRVLGRMNEVLADLSERPLETLGQLFEVDEDFLCTFAELDHYPRPDARYWGPLFASDEGVTPEWPAGGGERVFAYLTTEYRDFDKVVGQLRDLSCRTLIHAGGVSDKQVTALQARNVMFSREPVRMADAAREAGLVICHGGHGTSAAALLAGRPLLVLHRHVEQILMARNVVDRGLGKAVNLESKSPSYKQLVRDILADPGFAERAHGFAAKYADFEPSRQHDLIAARCEAILAA